MAAGDMGLFGPTIVHAARRLVLGWRFTTAVVAILAVGVGANVAILDCLDVLWYRAPVGVADAEDLYVVGSIASYAEYVDTSRRVSSVELASVTAPVETTLGTGTSAIQVRVQCVSDSFFDVLRVRPISGRTFSTGSEWGPRAAEVLISHSMWSTHLGQSPGAVGQRLAVGNRQFEIIGILPRGFVGASATPADLWTHIAADPTLCSFTATNLLTSRDARWTATIARLKPEVTTSAAQAEIAAAVQPSQRGRASPRESGRDLLPLIGARGRRNAGMAQVAIWLAAGSVSLYLIAFANVLCLTWNRTLGRRHELVIRLSLGASRARLIADVLIEGLMLAAVCIVVAAAFSLFFHRMLGLFFPWLRGLGWTRSTVWMPLGFAAMMACSLSVVLPLLYYARGDLLSQPNSQSRGHSARTTGRRILVVAQVALSFVLLVSAGLFRQSVDNVYREVGYDLDRVLIVSPELAREGYFRTAQIEDVMSRLASALRSPVVESVATTSGSILGAGTASSFVTAVRTTPSGPSTIKPLPVIAAVSPNYFDTVGLRITNGRTFRPADVVGQEPEIVVDENVAAGLWPGESPIGRCVYLLNRTACSRVVGVTADRTEADGAAYSTLFLPAHDDQIRSQFPPQTLAVRVRSHADDALASVVAAVRSQPAMPFINVQPLSSLAGTQAASLRLGAQAFGFFAVSATLLAAVALYAVLALEVNRRRMETGIRVALGASPFQVARTVILSGGGLCAVGAVLGTGAAILASGVLRSMLTRIADLEVSTLLAAWMTVMITAACSLALPAAAAARTDAVVSLRGSE